MKGAIGLIVGGDPVGLMLEYFTELIWGVAAAMVPFCDSIQGRNLATRSKQNISSKSQTEIKEMSAKKTPKGEGALNIRSSRR